MSASGQPFKAPDQNRAGATLSLRLVACGYLIYLAWTIVRDRLNGASTLPPALAWISTLVFAAAGAAFGVYAWRTYRKQMQAAEEAAKSPASPAEEPESADSGEDPV